MKKIISILLILCTLLTLISCNTADEPSANTADEPNESETPTETTEKATKPKQTDKDKGDKPMIKPSEDGILKILTIGNSFSDDTMQYLYKVAKSAGVEKIKLGNLYIGGCSLDLHASNARSNARAYDYRTNSADAWVTTPSYRMKDAILSENWDFISLQQASGSSGIADTYSELEYLIGYVRELAPESKLVWNMTWAYQQDSTHGEFPKYESDQQKMYESIVGAVQNKVLACGEFEHIVPNGTAIQNARTSYVGDRLTRDGFHLSLDLGRYIASLTFFSKLTGISIENIEYAPDGVDPDLQKIAIESATNAIAEPWQVTNSVYTEEPVFDESPYELLDLEITLLGYWNSASGATSIDTVSSNHINFAASRKFSPEDIPVGSVIVLADGWRYRPDAWKSAGPQSSRPDNVTAKRVVVTESWWGEYINRAFNISKADGSSLEGVTLDEINQAFKIYVPKG